MSVIAVECINMGTSLITLIILFWSICKQGQKCKEIEVDKKKLNHIAETSQHMITNIVIITIVIIYRFEV